MASVIKSTCIFCLKSIPEINICTQLEDNVSVTETKCWEDEEVKLFLKLVYRYVSPVNQQENKSITKIARFCCTSCLGNVKSFNQLYHEMECLKLKLDWKLEKFKNRIEYANRVPSRFHRIKTNAALEDKSEMLEKIMIFRRDFVKKCSIHLSKSTPKVNLQQKQSSPNEEVSKIPFRVTETVNEANQVENEIRFTNPPLIKVEPVQHSLEDDSIYITNLLPPDEDPIDIEYQFPDIKPFRSPPHHEPTSTNLNENSQQTSSLKETQNSSNTLKCSHCSLKFLNKGKLLRHTWYQHTHKGETGQNQIIIPETSTTIGEWVNKTGAKFKCSKATCTNLTFMTEECLQDHSKLHGSFSCKFCGDVKDFAPDLATHELKVHNKLKESSKIKQCPRCDYKIPKQFPHEGYLNHHLSLHQNLFMDGCRCPICKQAFHSKNQRHLVKSLLTHWLNFHDDDSKKTNSLILSGRTRLRRARTLDKRVGNGGVTGEKPRHHCKICRKSFQDVYKLKSHLFSLHKSSGSEDSTRNWKFECKLCGKKFFDKFIFNRHQKTLHQHKSFTCQLCGTKSVNYKALQQHNLRYHSKKCKQEK